MEPAESQLGEIVGLAGLVCEAPIAHLWVHGGSHPWLRSAVELSAAETSVVFAVCAREAGAAGLHVVKDLRENERFADVIGPETSVRFYAGVPVESEAGMRFGTLSVLDLRPRELSDCQVGALRALARQAALLLQLKGGLREGAQAGGADGFDNFFEFSNDAVLVVDPVGETILEANAKACEIYGYDRQFIIGRSLKNLSPDLELGERRLKDLLGVGSCPEFEAVHCDPGGTPTYLLVIPSLINYKGRKAILNINRDITARKQALEALRQSEKNYRSLLANIPDVTWTADSEGRVHFVSLNVARISGFTAVEVRRGGRDFWYGRIHPDDRDGVRGAYERLLARGEFFDAKYRLQRKDGQWVWLHDRAVSTYAEGGLKYADGVFSDVTSHRLAEEALHESNEALRTLIEASPLAIVSLDSENRISTWNPAAERIFGWRKEELLNRPIPVFSEQMRELTEDLLRRAHAGERLMGIEMVRHRKDGSPVNTSISISKMLDSEGRGRGLMAVIEDITLRKSWEEALREANRRAITEYERLLDRLAVLAHALGTAKDTQTIFRAVRDFALDSTPASGIFISLYDEEKNLRTAAYGWSAGEEVDLSSLPPLPLTNSPHSRAVATGKVIITDDFQAAIAGEPEVLVGMERDPRLPRSALSVPMLISGRVLGGIEVQSVEEAAFNPEHATAMRMAANLAAIAFENEQLIKREADREMQLRQSQKMEAVGQLAGGIAHDFNNLLAIMILHLDLMKLRIGPDDQLRRRVDEIKAAADRAASLTRQLLAFSRRQVMQLKVLSLNEVVTDIDNILRRTIGAHIDLITRLEPELGLVNADPVQLEQVLLNLVVNSRDAMPRGGKLVIETRNAKLDRNFSGGHYAVTPGRYTQLTVSDTGHGMNAETQRRVFEPFFTTKELGKGTGLGLSTVYGIVKQSGGYISVSSEPGKGTTFNIYLPRVDEPPAAAPAVAEARDMQLGEETILLAEDEPSVRGVIRELLMVLGYRVLEADNGERAAEMLGYRVVERGEGKRALERAHAGAGGEHVSLLLTDVVMPGMGGLELISLLREVSDETKVLVMSGNISEAEAVAPHNIIDYGKQFIGKPPSLESLSRKVREALESP